MIDVNQKLRDIWDQSYFGAPCPSLFEQVNNLARDLASERDAALAHVTKLEKEINNETDH